MPNETHGVLSGRLRLQILPALRPRQRVALPRENRASPLFSFDKVGEMKKELCEECARIAATNFTLMPDWIKNPAIQNKKPINYRKRRALFDSHFCETQILLLHPVQLAHIR